MPADSSTETLGSSPEGATSIATNAPAALEKSLAHREAEEILRKAQTGQVLEEQVDQALKGLAGDGGKQPPRTETGAPNQGEGNIPQAPIAQVEKPAADAVRTQELRQANTESQKYLRRIAAMDQAGLQNELSGLQANADNIQRQLDEDPELNDADRTILEGLLRENKGQQDGVNRFLTPLQEQGQKTQQEAIDAQRQEKFEAAQKQTASIEELNIEVATRGQALEGLRVQLAKAETAGDTAKIVELQNQIIAENEKYNQASAARETAVKRAIDSGDITTVADSDQFKGLYALANSEGRANYLIDINRNSEALPPEEAKALREKARRGEKLSINEAALLYGDLSKRIVAGDKKAFKDLAGINGRYPEIGIAILNAHAQNENLKRIREKMPKSLFEKALKGDRGLILTLLMLAFATTAAAAKALGQGMSLGEGVKAA